MAISRRSILTLLKFSLRDARKFPGDIEFMRNDNASSGTLVRELLSSAFTGYINEVWDMNTASMQRCGYVLVLEAYERTIYNGSHDLPGVNVSIGFAII